MLIGILKKEKLLIGLFVLFLSCPNETFCRKKDTLYVGAAQAPINPPIGSFIAGHEKNRKFTGALDSLFAKAVVLSDGKDSWAIITVDCIGLMHPQLLEIRKIVSKQLPDSVFDSDHIVLSSTHTHSGPDVVGLWGPDLTHTGVDIRYINFLVNTAAEMVIKAWNNKRFARGRSSITQHGTAWVSNICEPKELDRSVTVLQFLDQKGKNIATLTNFACHPTFLDAVNDQVSTDYIGGFYRLMDGRFGGVNLFLQGSIGGWVQPEHEPKTFEQANYRGWELAKAVIKSLRKNRKLQGTQVRYATSQFTIPVENPGFIHLAAIGVIKRNISKETITEIAWFGVGNAQFATHPGESVPAMSLATKKLMKYNGPKFVLGLAMDAIGYILKPEFFETAKKIPHSQYLCSMSAGKETASFVMHVLGQLAMESDWYAEW